MTARKTLNVRFAAAVAAATAAAATAVHFVHAYQVQRGAQELLAESARLEQAGEPAEATEYLDRYLLLNRDDADARTRYALLVAGQSKTPRQKERAYQALTEALARSPGRVEVLRTAVPVAADLGLRREARGFLEELRKAGVEDAGLMRHQARLELAERKPDKAEEWYRKAVNAAPADPEVSSELAAVLREHLHAPDLADREIDRLLRDGRGAPPVQLAAAQYFLRWGDAAKAERAVTTPAGDAAADDAGVLLAAAEAALAQNKTAAARRHLDRGVARHPRDSRFPSGLARLELRGGNRERALALVGPHAAAQNLPPEELWRLGNLLIDAGDLGKADDLIGRLGRDVPRWVPDYLRGCLAVGRQAWAEARQLFAAVTGGGHELPPELARQTYLLLADCHGRLGNPDGQLAAYRRVTELAPQWVPGRRLLGSAYATLGRLNEAAQEYRIVAVADPDATVEFARVLARQALRVPPADRRWAEIEELIDRAPPARRPEAQLLLAEVRTAQGRVEDARGIAQAERDRDPKQPGPWAVLVALAEREPAPAAAEAVITAAESQTGPRAEWAAARVRRVVRAGGADTAARLAALEPGVDRLPDADRIRTLPLLGEALAAAGDLPAAERVWGRVAAARPTEPEARFRLFGLALDRGDEARARALAAELARLEGPVAPLAAFAEAALHARRARQGDRGAIGPAREAVARAAAARPAWPLATLLEAELCELGGEKDRAAERYEAVVAAGRAPAAAVKRLVHLLAEQGRYADARGVLARLPDQAADAEFARADAQLAILGATGRDAAQARRQGLEAARRAVGPGATDYREYLWLGEMALLAGEPVEAAAAFRRACELSPAAPEPCVAIVLLLARSDVKAAEAELEVARARIPADLLPRVLAVGYEAVGKRAEAGEQYRAMAAARPDDPAALRDLSAFLARTGDLAGAEQTLRRTLALGARLPAPAAAWVRRALAVVLVTRGGFDRLREAGSLVDHAAAPDATDDDRWTRAIVLAAQPARRREAIDILEKLTVPATASPDARFLLAKLYDRAGRWPMARAELAGLARAGSPNPDHLAYFAAGLVRRGELAEAEQWVQKLAERAGETFAAVELRARVLKAKGRSDAAAKLIRDFAAAGGARATLPAAALLDTLDMTADAEGLYRAYAADSKEPSAPLALAGFLARRGRLSEAMPLYEAAWKAGPPEAVGRSSVAALRAGRGSPADAGRVEAWIDAAVAAAPQSVGLLVLKADLYQFQERFADAVAVYREVLRRDPRQVVALNNLAYLLAVRGGRPDEALALIDAGLAVTGPHPDLLDTRGVVLTRAGRADEAAADLARAVADAPAGEKHFHLALAHLRAGRKAAAATGLRDATEAGLRRDDLHPLERPEWDRLSAELARP